ncbi:MAG: ATP-binding protein [Candidatus Eisenbacteria bacterium]|uniref:ATP-binding protein n=1 Tax=Eiseniibacteriota bacterium TaxID=2212470 RepID=A0A948RXZ4_UNCEI|nr:ATP-binding protein [Candidatus Eisenbacteria bacterium]MBU1947480.1 ATP-binding protein [Candidatus Eisenbacteria bacterium]MBU2693093.1 ATP-binding protein [Candidatus Eisenbacteria bacterium]
MEQLDRTLAQRIIESLGSLGTPPNRGFQYFTVGLDQQIQILIKEYLDGLLPPPSNGGTFKLIQGDFGCGKTHFLYCILREARQRGYATALVQLSLRECPFDKAAKVYQAIARRISIPIELEERETADPEGCGFPEVLRRFADAIQEAGGEEAVTTWLRKFLRRVPVEIVPFRVACISFLEAYLKGDDATEQTMEQWLLGMEVPRTEYRSRGVFARLEESNAMGMITSMIQVVRGLSLGDYRVPGVVLAFDEMDRTMSISAKRSQTLLDNLRRLVDSAVGGGLPGVMMIYAVPPEFMRTTVADYPALKQRLHSITPFGPNNPSAPVIDLEDLLPEAGKLLAEIGSRILDIYLVARQITLDKKIQQEHAKVLAEIVSRDSAASGTRRAYVKSWIALLNDQVAQGERALSEEELAGLASGYLEETFAEPSESATYQDL